MDKVITMADGTRIENAETLETDGNLFLYFYGSFDMKELFNTFQDTEKTATITAERFGIVHVHEGYTHMTAIREESADLMTVMMRKER